MKERPILFSGPMVRATLEGRKTQTRRVINSVTGIGRVTEFQASDTPGYAWTFRDSRLIWNDLSTPDIFSRCPHGQPGDRLWVKEGWAEEHPLAVQQGRYSQPGRAGIPGPPPVIYHTIYRADGEPLQVWRNKDGSYPYFTLTGPHDEVSARFPEICSNYSSKGGKGVYWEQARHMPRWACRLVLEITDVRVERLQDISEEDARAEGVANSADYIAAVLAMYGLRDDDNPWVWAISFKRVEV